MAELYSITGLFHERFPGTSPWGGHFIRGKGSDKREIEGMLIDIYGPSNISGSMDEEKKRMAMLQNRNHEDRPWGWFERFTNDEPSTVKILRVEEGKRLSLQRHRKRSEWWRVIEGVGIARVDEREWEVRVGDEVERDCSQQGSGSEPGHHADHPPWHCDPAHQQPRQ